jgi:anti-sigma B factor antagonist
MQLEQSEKGGIKVLRLTGRLDLEGTEAIESDFATATSDSPQSMIVDLQGVPFLASLGMRMFVTAARTLRGRDRKLVLLKPQEAVRAALDVAGLSRLLLIADDEATAHELASEG